MSFSLKRLPASLTGTLPSEVRVYITPSLRVLLSSLSLLLIIRLTSATRTHHYLYSVTTPCALVLGRFLVEMYTKPRHGSSNDTMELGNGNSNNVVTKQSAIWTGLANGLMAVCLVASVRSGYSDSGDSWIMTPLAIMTLAPCLDSISSTTGHKWGLLTCLSVLGIYLSFMLGPFTTTSINPHPFSQIRTRGILAPIFLVLIRQISLSRRDLFSIEHTGQDRLLKDGIALCITIVVPILTFPTSPTPWQLGDSPHPTLIDGVVLLLVTVILGCNPPPLTFIGQHPSLGSLPGINDSTRISVFTEVGLSLIGAGVLEKELGRFLSVASICFLAIAIIHSQEKETYTPVASNPTSEPNPEESISRSQAIGGLCLAILTGFIMLNGTGYQLDSDANRRDSVTGPNWRPRVDYELALAHYDEPADLLAETIRTVKRKISFLHTTRVTVYSKKLAITDRTQMRQLLIDSGADEVVSLPNVGREGETYLQHIVRRYENPAAPLAEHTFFLQPHIAWGNVAYPRLNQFSANTGFLSLGPYLNATCFSDGSERDSHGMGFPRIAQIYSMFRKDLCPPTGFAITWAGQFLVSKKRILDTPKETYGNLLEYFNVEKDSGDPKEWIWDEGFWDTSASNPTHGHWLERSWPAIFNCMDPKLAHDCGEGSGSDCECLD